MSRHPSAVNHGRVPSPLVVAHRGSSVAVAEHTLAAYERAIAEGADALECDVRLTSDGHLVCLHDRTLSRTSDARGLVSESRLEELHDADFGTWAMELPESADELISDDRHEPPPRVKVLELADLLALVLDHERRVELYVETKHPTRYGGLVEQRLVELLGRYGVLRPDPPVTVMSFATSALRRVRSLAPELPRVQLMDKVPLRFRDGSLPVGADVAGPSIEILRMHPNYVRRVHRGGKRVYVWTVDEPSDILLAADLRVDAIITNRPADVLARLGRRAG